MLEIILAMLMAFSCPNHTGSSTGHHGSQVTTLDDDTGGETGHTPPVRPPHP